MENNFQHTFDINWFSKHSKKYEYDESDKKMLESVEISFGQFVNGYTAGVHETYINILRMYEDAANYLRLIAPQMYENYLDEKKERQRERK